jgi:hypothetical protein
MMGWTVRGWWSLLIRVYPTKNRFSQNQMSAPATPDAPMPTHRTPSAVSCSASAAREIINTF